MIQTPPVMLPVIPKSETSFWGLVRCLFFPVGVVSFLICLIGAIFTALGQGTPTIDGQPTQGIGGVIRWLAIFPFLTAFFALGFACAIYIERQLLGKMDRSTPHSHISLFYALFALFEVQLWVAVLVSWSVDPRQMSMSWLDDAAGITAWFSLLGLSIVSWLLRRAAPRVARAGWISVLTALVAGSLHPAIP